MPLKIQTIGTSTSHHPSQRAVLTIDISARRPIQHLASEAVTRTAAHVRDALKALAPKTATGDPAPDAAITFWSMSSLGTGSYVPWEGGVQKAGAGGGSGGAAPERVYTARTTIESRWRDFAALGATAGKLAAWENVEIRHVKWELTSAKRAELVRETRVRAVREAVRKARDYASAVGKGEGQVVEVDDTDIPYRYEEGWDGDTRHTVLTKRGREDLEVQFEPGSCEVRSAVKVVFVCD